MRKKRILMCAESSHVDSGFGNYTRNILSRLHNSGKYEIAEFSAYRNAQIPKKEPWTVYANAPTDPEALKLYNANPINAFGAWGFETACFHFKPDIVFDVRDYWMLNFPETSPLRPYFHWVVAPTIDSAPQKPEWLQTFASADTVSAHTQWGIDYLRSTNIKMNLVKPVNDAVDTDVFRPSSQPKNFLKTQLGINSNDFIVGSVMRNQKRKLIPNVISIIKKLNNKIPNIKLYLHTSFPDMNAWDLPKLLMEHDALNLVYLTYKCQSCKKSFAKTFSSTLTACPHCKQKTATICNVAHGVETNELNNILNSFDLYLQYAICEGFGIPPVEAAACGVPVITIDHGAMREVGDNIGADIVPVKCIFRELETNADRVYPDDEACVSIIEKKYETLKDATLSQQMKLKETLRNKLLHSYSWDKTAKDFEDIFDNIVLTGLQGKWDAPAQMPNPTVKVPPLPSHRDVINFIVTHIIGMPHVIKSHSIQNIISSLDCGYIMDGSRIQKFQLPQAIKSLENLMNTKTIWENIRVGNAEIPETMKHVVEYK